jgi:hypothetical protein
VTARSNWVYGSEADFSVVSSAQMRSVSTVDGSNVLHPSDSIDRQRFAGRFEFSLLIGLPNRIAGSASSSNDATAVAQDAGLLSVIGPSRHLAAMRRLVAIGA